MYEKNISVKEDEYYGKFVDAIQLLMAIKAKLETDTELRKKYQLVYNILHTEEK